ncbi:TolC family protein [Pontiella sulfatireligans]|uniref:Cobalt-zinc-cadmium resistance protein CzcC n=1 Tax=Pontiella sulfatireligans TaxID=2750658 RepID=A0A6C2URH8_9BACT|nr:TolC family protein [Pontiella sulfatireligans]VGO21536.1 Cobalt-zinc-cadmium resistance protein CzcC [Pontiella sulfatireligans]
MKKYIVLLCSVALVGIADSEPLTLDRALELARQNSPELRAARLNTQSAEKAVGAAGRWLNPKLEFEAEGVGGDLDGFNDTEYTIALMQTFERGGKRKHARAVAQESIGIAFQAEAEKELMLLADVRLAFIEVLAQQEVGGVREEQEELGRAFVQVAKTRFEAGGASEMELVQAELQLEEILLSQTCCFGDLEAARTRLASLIGISEKELGELAGGYYTLDTVETGAIAASHPALQRMDARIAVTRAQAQRAKAQDATDITLAAGYKYEAAEDVNTFVLGAKIPLNFVRSGRVEEAAQLLRADALGAEREEVRRRLQQGLSVIAALYKGAKLEAEMTRDKLIPKAEEAYQLSRAGYEAGRYSWVELIASQQNLADIRIRQIDALKDAHLARAEIHRFMKEGM